MWPFNRRKEREREKYRQGAEDIAKPLSDKLDRNSEEIRRTSQKLDDQIRKQHEFNEHTNRQFEKQEKINASNRERFKNQEVFNNAVSDGLEDHEIRISKNEKRIKASFVLCTVLAVLLIGGYLLVSNSGGISVDGAAAINTLSQNIEDAKEKRAEQQKIEKEIALKEKEAEAEAKLKEAEAKLKEAEAKAKETEAEAKLKEAEAKVKEAEAKLAEAENEKNKTETQETNTNESTEQIEVKEESEQKEEPSTEQSMESSPKALYITNGPAPDVFKSGKLSDTINYHFEGYTNNYGGVLVLSGAGDLPEFFNHNINFELDVYNYQKLIVEPGITSISKGLFKDTGFEEIVLPDTLTYIGKGAFVKNNMLKSIIIPASVNHIDYSAFNYCAYLEKVIIYNPNIKIESSVFDYCPDLVIYGPAGSAVEQYAKDNFYDFSPL